MTKVLLSALAIILALIAFTLFSASAKAEEVKLPFVPEEVRSDPGTILHKIKWQKSGARVTEEQFLGELNKLGFGIRNLYQLLDYSLYGVCELPPNKEITLAYVGYKSTIQWHSRRPKEGELFWCEKSTGRPLFSLMCGNVVHTPTPPLPAQEPVVSSTEIEEECLRTILPHYSEYGSYGVISGSYQGQSTGAGFFTSCTDKE
ncbi:MAG: hypothetical protein MN733_23905 [Nitrososphaera sp.]|nr:hypothetical protein [Nitrososphaera sp.]